MNFFQSNTKLSIILLCTAVFALTSRTSFAQTEDVAQQKYKDGIVAFEAGDYRSAAEAFRAAYTAKASWKMFYNIGQAEAAGHRYGLALEAFETYLVQGGDDVPPDRHEQLLNEIQRLRLLVGVIEVNADPGAELLVDDVSRGTTPFEGAIRVSAGKHHILVRRNGDVLVDKSVKVSGGMTTKIDATSTALAAAGGTSGAPGDEETNGPPEDQTTDATGSTADESAYQSKAGKPLLIAGIATGAVGLGGVVVGAIFGAKAISAKDKYNSISTVEEAMANSEKYSDDYDSFKKIAIIGFAAGGTLLATGVALTVVGLMKKKKGKLKKVAISPAIGGVSMTF